MSANCWRKENGYRSRTANTELPGESHQSHPFPRVSRFTAYLVPNAFAAAPPKKALLRRRVPSAKFVRSSAIFYGEAMENTVDSRRIAGFIGVHRRQAELTKCIRAPRPIIYNQLGL